MFGTVALEAHISRAERRSEAAGRAAEHDDVQLREAGIAAHERAERELSNLRALADAVKGNGDARIGVEVQAELAAGRADREAVALASLDRLLEGNPRAATGLSELIRQVRRGARG